jgi:hypothetical protein
MAEPASRHSNAGDGHGVKPSAAGVAHRHTFALSVSWKPYVLPMQQEEGAALSSQNTYRPGWTQWTFSLKGPVRRRATPKQKEGNWKGQQASAHIAVHVGLAPEGHTRRPSDGLLCARRRALVPA